MEFKFFRILQQFLPDNPKHAQKENKDGCAIQEMGTDEHKDYHWEERQHGDRLDDVKNRQKYFFHCPVARNEQGERDGNDERQQKRHSRRADSEKQNEKRGDKDDERYKNGRIELLDPRLGVGQSHMIMRVLDVPVFRVSVGHLAIIVLLKQKKSRKNVGCIAGP